MRVWVKYINERVVGYIENGTDKPHCRYLFAIAKDKGRLLLQESRGIFTIEDVSAIP